MTKLETNMFLITNLEELSSKYRLYRIKGLQPGMEGYYQSRQHIIRNLSYKLQSPVTIIDQDHVPHLVVRDDVNEIPSPFPVVKSIVQFEQATDVLELDYTLRSPQNDEICIRFLQFMLQAPLRRNSELWQPGSGQPFFLREPSYTTRHLGRYEGFSVRALVTHNGEIGFCVDITNKFIGRKPLPTRLKRDEFASWKNQSCIYHYGHQWYNIRAEALGEFDVSNHMILRDSEFEPLINVIVNESKKPLPPDLADLPHDSAVVLYRNNRGEERAAPTGLCYPIYGTADPKVKHQHKYTIFKPGKRRSKIKFFAARYLKKLRFGDLEIRVSDNPHKVPRKRFPVPDLEFGNGVVISTRGTEGSYQIDLTELGQARLKLLQRRDVGFYEKSPLDRQYFVFPQSAYDSFGPYLLNNLKDTVNRLFPQKRGYDPEIITYDDRGPKTYIGQGVAILDAIDEKGRKPGFAVVMIHHITDKNIREEDPLEAMVVRELRDRSIIASVIHTEVGKECYHLTHDSHDEPCYAPLHYKQGKLKGYLRNVALNKVLLNNGRWPFVLATQLHADIVIGIDVKNNTAGLLIVGNRGKDIRTLIKTSKQKERLSDKQICSYLTTILREELSNRTEPVHSIVIHRDGRAYDSEIKGATVAIENLKGDGLLDSNVMLTILEIPKTAPVRVRLFDVNDGQFQNPQVGDYYINGNEGYVCSTGRVFLHNGTVRPLHVKRVCGNMPIKECLEDVYYLTVLAWTRPEGCVRDPITIRLNDRFLSEEAAEYDAEELEYERVLQLENT